MGKQTISRTTLAKGVTACVVVAASLGIVQIGEYSLNSAEEAASTTVSSTTGTVAYTPGTYTATAAGIQSDVTVSCTFDEGSITSITVDVSGETAGLGADIGDEMIESFLAAQSSNVDGVSGATITSDALKAALEDCIAQATGGSGGSEEADAETTEDSGSSDEEDADAAETEAAAEAETDAAEDTEAGETETAAEAADNSSETETESEADSEVSAAASDAATTSSGNSTYTPGTYTATAAGMESNVTVTVTVDETSILSLGIDVSGETDGIGAAIGPEISEQILNAQSADVDGVSGATVTSTAVKTALVDALDQAAGASSDSTDDTDTAAAVAEEETGAVETETEVVETETAEAETEVVEIETAEAETEAAETKTETADTEAVDEPTAIEGDSSFVPGTYTASAAGISSDVTVTCTFDETGLVSIEADVSGETSGIGADIGDTMIARVLEAQSSDVDGVSGATITSDAFKAAVADCMEQAGFVAEAAESETETEAAAEAESAASDESDTELAAVADAPFVPGTYTATAQGMESEITVNVTFDEYNIIAVGTWLEGETDGVGADIGEEISNQILEAQSADVDGVSGATVTSTAVKEAVADCIAQAKADSEDVGNEEIETEAVETETAEAETEAIEAEAETAADEAAEVGTEVAETETADESAAIEGGSGFIPGTYTASAAGISSDVTVTCTFDETGLVSIEADVSGETSGIGADIGDTMIARVLEAQSSDVDGVSGATITSDAFKAAVADCMEQAGFVAEEAETETEEESATEAASTAADSSDSEFAAAPDAPFVPGTYTATAQGMESEITVNVTFDEYNIVAVGTWLEGETDGVGADIGEEISNQVLEAQSADVDGVSGATVTSTAVKEAVANCIAQAKADSEDIEEMTEADSEEETESTAAAESADDDEAEASDEASLSSLYTAGIYSASAEGISSDVVVTVAFDDDSITSIGYDLSGETATIGALIGPEISGQILTAQSADVDGVSGATITSEAFKAAVADCIAQAQAGSSDLVIIGGADGATSIFLAGTTDEGETEQPETDDAE